MRPSILALLATPPAVVLAIACGTSGSTGDGAASTASTACVFTTRTVYDCPGETLAPGAWITECVDHSDCHAQVGSTIPVDGCSRTTEVQGAHAVAGTCAAILGIPSSDGSDAGGPIVLDAGGPAQPCSPVAIGGFAPQWRPPRAKSAACTTTQIDSFRQCVDDSATTVNPPSCLPWGHPTADDQTCLACLQSSESDPTWGPIVVLPTETLINVAGCLALAEGKTDGSGCAGALQADQQCMRAACLPACPLGASDPTLATSEVQEESLCEVAANAPDGGVCAAFEKPAECAGSIAQGDAGTAAEAQCFGLPTGNTDAIFEAVATAFCGK